MVNPFSVHNSVQTGNVTMAPGAQLNAGNVTVNPGHPSVHLALRATLRRDEFDPGVEDERIALGSVSEIHLNALLERNAFAILDFAAGMHLYRTRQYARAADHFLRAAETIHPDNYPGGIDLAIGSAYLHLTLHDEAIRAFDRALSTTPESEPALRAALLNARGYARSSQGYAEVALDDLDASLRITEEILGVRDPVYALRLSNKAVVLTKTGEMKRAEALFKQALSTLEAAHGRRHPRVAIVLNNVGVMWYERGQFDKASSLLTEALSIDESELGSSHPNVAVRLYNLASLSERTGDPKMALERQLGAYRIDRMALGTHPYTARDAERLADLQGVSEALVKLDEAADIYGALRADRGRARALRRKGDVQCGAGAYRDAIKEYSAAREIWVSLHSDREVFDADDRIDRARSGNCK
ncbi:MAG: tetratricopeptide repeat protein [Polyangiaceae bacterium]